MKTEDTEARSKPDTVDRPVRTACTFVHHYNSTQDCNTNSFLYIPLPLDQHHISDVAKWRQGGIRRTNTGEKAYERPRTTPLYWLLKAEEGNIDYEELKMSAQDRSRRSQ